MAQPNAATFQTSIRALQDVFQDTDKGPNIRAKGLRILSTLIRLSKVAANASNSFDAVDPNEQNVLNPLYEGA